MSGTNNDRNPSTPKQQHRNFSSAVTRAENPNSDVAQAQRLALMLVRKYYMEETGLDNTQGDIFNPYRVLPVPFGKCIRKTYQFLEPRYKDKAKTSLFSSVGGFFKEKDINLEVLRDIVAKELRGDPEE